MQILERQVRVLNPGMEAKMQEVWARYQPIEKKYGIPPHKRYRYFSGDNNNVFVLEREWESMAAWETAMTKLMADPDWQKVNKEAAGVYTTNRFEFLMPVPNP